MNYPELLQKIMTEGKVVAPHGREIREIMHAKLTVSPEAQLYAWPGIRPFGKIKEYWMSELAWYMSGNREASHIAKHAGLWDKIKNPDGTLNSNYGHLVFYNRTAHPSLGMVTKTPFDWAVECLEGDKDSRQAIMTYNTGGFNFEGNDDYICTQHQAFFIRDNVLRCFVALRSSDAIFGLPYNMPWWSFVQQQLLLRLRCKYPDLVLGDIEVDIYSAHIYQRHYDLVNNMLASGFDCYKVRVKKFIPRLGQDKIWWYKKYLKDYVQITKNKEDA